MIELNYYLLKGIDPVMSEENKKKKDEELRITDEDNVEEQFEF